MAMPARFDNDESLLHFDVHAENDRPISIAPIGQTFVLLQRLLNKAALQEEDPASFFSEYDRKTALEMVRMTLHKVEYGDDGTHADPHQTSKPPTLQLVIDPGAELAKGALEAAGGLVAKAVIKQVASIAKGIFPFKPNDATRKHLEELAAIAARGGLIYGLRLGSLYCFIDKSTHEKLEQYKKRHFRGPQADFTGMVIGSNMRRRYIDVHIDQYSSDISCTYAKARVAEFEPWTRVRTSLTFKGRPIWEGTDKPNGLPQRLEMVSIKGSPIRLV